MERLQENPREGRGRLKRLSPTLAVVLFLAASFASLALAGEIRDGFVEVPDYDVALPERIVRQPDLMPTWLALAAGPRGERDVLGALYIDEFTVAQGRYRPRFG